MYNGFGLLLPSKSFRRLYGYEFAVSESDSHAGSDSTLDLGSLDVLACVGLPDLGAI